MRLCSVAVRPSVGKYSLGGLGGSTLSAVASSNALTVHDEWGQRARRRDWTPPHSSQRCLLLTSTPPLPFHLGFEQSIVLHRACRMKWGPDAASSPQQLRPRVSLINAPRPLTACAQQSHRLTARWLLKLTHTHVAMVPPSAHAVALIVPTFLRCGFERDEVVSSLLCCSVVSPPRRPFPSVLHGRDSSVC